MATQRIEKLRESIHIDKYPICIEKVRLMTESYKRTDGEPEILRRAKALAYTLDNIPIFIKEGELISATGRAGTWALRWSSITGPGQRRRYMRSKMRGG